MTLNFSSGEELGYGNHFGSIHNGSLRIYHRYPQIIEAVANIGENHEDSLPQSMRTCVEWHKAQSLSVGLILVLFDGLQLPLPTPL